jgi:outer membrane scaffolding protein for murein synthesis (MipA/OmpV family)
MFKFFLPISLLFTSIAFAASNANDAKYDSSKKSENKDSPYIIRPDNLEIIDLKNKNNYRISASLGVIYAPASLGSKKYNANPLPDISIGYKNIAEFSLLEGLKVNLYSKENFILGTVLAYNLGRISTNSNTDPMLTGVDNVHSSGVIGLYMAYKIHNFAFYNQISHYFGSINSYGVSLSGTYTKPITEKYFTGISANISYNGKDYNNKFFGVNQETSSRTGLSVYEAKAGITNSGVALLGGYIFSQHTVFTLITGVSGLGSRAYKSSLIEERGRKVSPFVGLSVQYTF